MGEPQVAKAAPSRLHRSSLTPEPESEPVKPKEAPDEAEGLLGSAMIEVLGAIVSTVKSARAGVGSVSPRAVLARTSNLCGPSARAP